jgi:hypothetical protein
MATVGLVRKVTEKIEGARREMPAREPDASQ